MKELLERERELAAVEKLLERRSGVLTIEAGVGIGKTSLVQAACRRARELDFDVLTACGSELERTSHSVSCDSCSSGASQLPEEMSAQR